MNVTKSDKMFHAKTFIYEYSAVLYNSTHLSLFLIILNDHFKYRQILCLHKQFPFYNNLKIPCSVLNM